MTLEQIPPPFLQMLCAFHGLMMLGYDPDDLTLSESVPDDAIYVVIVSQKYPLEICSASSVGGTPAWRTKTWRDARDLWNQATPEQKWAIYKRSSTYRQSEEIAASLVRTGCLPPIVLQ